MWFRNSANPGTWYHPSINEQINVTYDLLDEQGNFNFNFSFTGNLSGYNQAIVIVNTANDATYLPAPPNGYISWGPHGFTYYYNESEGIISSIDGSSNNITVNQNGVINKEDGSILRYMQLAREFTIQRYGGNPPFTIPHVQTFKSDIASAGLFSVDWDPISGWYHYITINPNWTDPSTITHEFGHYINYRMWNNNNVHWGLASDDLVEGWAIFYSFAARSYINKMYSDNIYTAGFNDDNTEYAPFRPGLRYGNIRYAQHGEPMKAACACNIWSLYDSYDGGNFEMSNYAGDNDDVSGYGTLVFESMRGLNEFNSTVSGIHFAFYNSVPLDLRPSVVDINFFMYNNLTSIPQHKMKSAQISNIGLTNISSSQIRLNWSPQSYPGSYTEVNTPTEYRVYKNISGNWQVIATSQFGTNYVDIPLSVSAGQYKFSATNSSGDSYGAIERQIFNVSLSAANYIEPGTGDYYKLNGANIGTTWNGAFLQGMNPLIIEAIPPGNYIFLKWSDGNTDNPRQISDGNIEVNAIYKGQGLSNSDEGYANNSQRKFVRTNDGVMYNLYESLNRVWIEKSTDNGSSWVIANGGKPIANFNSKNPSMCLTPLGGTYPLSIVLESDGTIFFYEYRIATDQVIYRTDIYTGNYYTETKPVVTYCWHQQYYPQGPVVIWQSLEDDGFGGGLGLHYVTLNMDNWHNSSTSTPNHTKHLIPNTDGNSYNPSIAGNDPIHSDYTWKHSPMKFNLVWEQRGSVNSSIMFYQVERLANNVLDFTGLQNISAFNGYSKNYKPSIISIKDDNDNLGSRVVWLAERYQAEEERLEKGQGTENTEGAQYKTFFKDVGVSGFRSYGNKSNAPTINKLNNNSDYYLAFSEQSNLAGKVVIGSDPTTINQLETIGKDIQMGNGANENQVRALAFHSANLPYYFNKSPNMSNVTPKIKSLAIVSGREGVVGKDTAQFYFTVGDVILDDQPIEFIELPDTALINGKEILNEYLVTNPFTLNDNSVFYYSVQYGITDSASAIQALTDSVFINFTVQLLDANTDEIIGTFDNVTYNSDSVFIYNNIAYQVNVSGLNNRLVKLRLKTETNHQFDYSLTQRYAEESVLGKKFIKQINFNAGVIITEYAL